MLNTLSDTELVAEIQGGNMAAFRALYYRYADTIFALVSRLLGNRRGEAEDVVQDVFIQVHRSVAGFQGTSSLSTWLHRVAVNVCFSHLRRKRPSIASLDPDRAKEPAAPERGEARVDARRKIREMFALLDGMSETNRVVFTLYEFHGLTLSEISDILEIPLHTAASRLRRSREALMQHVIGDAAMKGGG